MPPKLLSFTVNWDGSHRLPNVYGMKLERKFDSKDNIYKFLGFANGKGMFPVKEFVGKDTQRRPINIHLLSQCNERIYWSEFDVTKTNYLYKN